MKNFHINLFKLTRFLEIIISIAIVIAIGISMITLSNGIKELFLYPLEKDAFQNFLGIAFNILIGIEFLKMIFKSNLSTVIEVLLFAIARQLIVEHTTVYENCVGIISIAILFVIRKYLFVPELDSDKKK
ncbi:MAG: phosphate-starvation-inducible PsiE family protein [Mobilitalea sp.]